MALAAVLVMGSFSAAEAAPQKPGLLTRALDRLHAWNQNRLVVKAAKQEFAGLVQDPTVKSLYKAAKSEQHTGWLQAYRMLHFANVGVQTIGMHSPLAWLSGALWVFSAQQSYGLTKKIADAGLAARSKTVAMAMRTGQKIAPAKLQRLHKAGVIDLKQVQEAAAKTKPARAKKTAQARRAHG
jgi:hypothetical protein